MSLMVGIMTRSFKVPDQWRTLTMNVGGAKRNYLEAEGATSKYFLFCMVKNNKY
jgi:hypothetical protein